MKATRILTFALVLLVATPAFAYKWEISKESNINLSVLVQPQLQMGQDMAPSGDAYSTDFFLRRARIMVFGAVNENLTYFLDTDQTNYGKNGNYAGQFYIQDAFMAYKIMEEFQLAVGLILLPFTRHNFQGATGLNGLDYHVDMLKFPTGSTKVWRDVGVQAYGWALEQKLHYRLGVFGGSQGQAIGKDSAAVDVLSNPEDLPRITGHVRYNILGKETDFFAKGIYFAKDPIVSVGVGVDFVPDSIMLKAPVLGAGNLMEKKAELGKHLAVAGDVFAEYPLSEEMEILFQGTFLYYDDGDKMAGSGTGFLLEAGFRWNWLEPVLGFDSFSSKADAQDYQAIRAGLNLWGNKHGANLKCEFMMFKAGDLSDDNNEYKKMFTLQTQFLF